MKNLSTTQKVLIVLGAIALIAFVAMKWKTWFPSYDGLVQRANGLEACYCKGVYKSMKRPSDCTRMCGGLI